MKKLLLLLFLFFIIYSCEEKQKELKIEETHIVETVYDSILAKKVGADDYGMRKYVIAFLKRGPNRNQDSITSVKLQRAHMDNIGKLAEQGKLILAGPFFGNDDLRGIYIFDVQSIDEAKKLTETDPAIQAGSLIMELKEWYGSAALKLVNEHHKKISKKEI
jgi:uncharacterized protein YciI